MKRFSICLIALMLLLVSVNPVVAVAQDTTSAVVQKDRVSINIIPPRLRVRPSRSAQFGFYAWRVDFKTSDAVSIAFGADTAMRSSNIRDIVNASSLRRCADAKDTSTLRCKIPMRDSVVVRGEGLRMILRDPAIVSLVLKQRPAIVWVSTFEPNGQFRLDRVNIRYADLDSAEVGRTSGNLPP